MIVLVGLLHHCPCVGEAQVRGRAIQQPGEAGRMANPGKAPRPDPADKILPASLAIVVGAAEREGPNRMRRVLGLRLA